jgi:hypothetical protein
LRGIHQQGNRQLPKMPRGYHMGQLGKALSARWCSSCNDRHQTAAGLIEEDPGREGDGDCAGCSIYLQRKCIRLMHYRMSCLCRCTAL